MRLRLRRLLDRIPGILVVGETPWLAGLAERASALLPDVVLLDIRLADGVAFEAVPALKRLRPRPRIFVVSSHADLPYRKRAELLKVDGYFDKTSQLETLQALLMEMVDHSESRLQPHCIPGGR